MPARIADAGFIIALNSRDAAERRWARAVLRTWQAPFITCEGALIEAAHFCAPALVARLVEDGDFAVAFDLAEQAGAVRILLEKYTDQAMDLTDACIVRMSELFPDCRVFSVDGDFNVYRRFRDQVIPTVYPPAIE
jgi:predicted nucleic acid-binding protein